MAIVAADRAVVLLSNRADFTGRNIAGCLRSLGKLEPLTGFPPSQACHCWRSMAQRCSQPVVATRSVLCNVPGMAVSTSTLP